MIRPAALLAAATLLGAAFAWAPVLRDPRLARAAFAGLTSRQEQLGAAVSNEFLDPTPALAVCEGVEDVVYLRYLLYPRRVDEGAPRRRAGTPPAWAGRPVGTLVIVTVAAGKPMPESVEEAVGRGELTAVAPAADGVGLFRVAR
jgi:hypothetical protein